ncbi:MAG: hypothetical protein E7057_01275 [Lentisphaerae bacterium]|nr:hypothetical protein [Lentisphaerota bacterium]
MQNITICIFIQKKKMARNPLVISGNQFNINFILTIISQQGFLPRTRINTGLVIAALFDQASLTGKTKNIKEGRRK